MCCYVSDLALGDPEGLFHPVKAMGGLISFLERRLNRKDNRRIKGAITVFIVVGISASFAYLLIKLAKGLHPALGALAWVYLGYSALSVKDLRRHAKTILQKIEQNSIPDARAELSKIVGRDTRDLDRDRITLAAIESVAEGTNDGIVAPLIYLILGGPVLAIAYKSINTLDSMLGYKNDKYLQFGWFAAKLDDIANFIPARICGFLIAASSFVWGSLRQSYNVMLRDGKKHPSPNSGISIAAMAGALGIRLGGTCSYQGEICNKEYLGEEKRAVQPSFINEALNISLVVSLVMISLGVLLKWVI